MTYDKAGILAFLKDAQQNPEGITDGKKNTYLVYRMLQALYQRQTADEQVLEQTKHVNGRGFTGVDAPILSSIAQSSQKYGDLTTKQVSKIVARKLQKYSGQLALAAATKMQEKSVVSNQEWEAQRIAFSFQGSPTGKIMLNQLGVDSLIASKRELENAIQAELAKVAILRKRHEAIEGALAVLRSSDDELMRVLGDLPKFNGVPKKSRIMAYDIDAAKIEEVILSVLQLRPMGKRNITELLDKEHLTYTWPAVVKILKTSPKISVIGVREQTRYVLR